MTAEIDKGESLEQAERELERGKKNPVEYVEPNLQGESQAVPNDPEFGAEWGLSNQGQTIGGVAGSPGADISATAAWDLTIGSGSTVVAVLDTGVARDHPDINPNLAANFPEAQGQPGVDDDNNGFVDDVQGWDFENGRPGVSDSNGHGTHVAGTIGARGNNGIGGVGVAPVVSILPLRTRFTTDEVIRAYFYTARLGIRVLNASYTFPAPTQAQKDAIDRVPNLLIIAAAGNQGKDNDRQGSWPASYQSPNVISVAATTNVDTLADFSNYGAQSVDMGAPGKDIFSASNRFASTGALNRFDSGTSMAAPHVTGAAALILAVAPGIPTANLKAALTQTGDQIPALQGTTSSGRRLNVLAALRSIAR